MAWPKRRSRPDSGEKFRVTEAINRLELHVLATIEPEFKMEDIPRAFWSDHLVDTLSKPFALVPDSMHAEYWEYNVTLPVLGVHDVTVDVRFDLRQVSMLRPAQGQIECRRPQIDPILDVLTRMNHEVKEFNKVRVVGDWLNKYATHGAANYYCPWLKGLLPSDHAVNSLSGQRFDEPKADMAHIAPLMRECGAIVATAILAPKNVRPYNGFSVSFRNQVAQTHPGLEKPVFSRLDSQNINVL